jgi:reactive intermediate/imine deaminase
MRPTILGICLTMWMLATAAAGQHKPIEPPGTGLDLPFRPGMLSADFLYLSGAIGNRPGSVEIVPGGIEAQAEQTFDNLKTVLDAAGLGWDRVVTANVYLADIRHFGAMNTAMKARFPGAARPARTTAEADIAIPGALLEVSMIAAAPGVTVERIHPDGWITPTSPYSWGVKAGDTLFLAGQVARNPKSGELVLGNVETQMQQILFNIEGVLAAAGMDRQDVVSCRVYLPDARDFVDMNGVYRTFFHTDPPARATVRARLANPDLKVEVECVAVAGDGRKVVTPDGKPSTAPFSPGILAGGRLYLSGMVGRGADGWGADAAEQTRITLERLGATLEAAGMTFRDVENATVYLSDIRFYQAMNQVYREVLGAEVPARATVGTQLMTPDALVEIRMVASRTAAPEGDEEAPE